jgi:hypothetical protein
VYGGFSLRDVAARVSRMLRLLLGDPPAEPIRSQYAPHSSRVWKANAYLSQLRRSNPTSTIAHAQAFEGHVSLGANIRDTFHTSILQIVKHCATVPWSRALSSSTQTSTSLASRSRLQPLRRSAISLRSCASTIAGLERMKRGRLKP